MALAPEMELELLEQDYRTADRRVESLYRAPHEARAGANHAEELRKAIERRNELGRELEVALAEIDMDDEDVAA